MSKTSVRHISIPQSPARMSRARSRTTTQATAPGHPSTMPSSLPSDSTSPLGKTHTKPSTQPSSRPSSLSTSSRAAAESSASRAMPSLDINIRDFFPDGDASVLKYVDEASIVREQAKAFQSYHDETLARALQISQETAITEAEARTKSKGKTKEPTSKLDGRGKTSSSSPSRKDVYVLGQPSALVPASDSVTKEGRREEGAGQPSPRELLLSHSSPTMTVPPLPMERYGPDEVTARMLAEDWRVSSLQDALLSQSDIPHLPVPLSASPSTSSSSSSSSGSSFLSSPASTTSTALSSPISSPISSFFSSSSASAAARKGDASPTHVIPMTIPAEAFYSRSSHARQSSSSTRSSTTSSLRNSPPQTSLTTSPPKDKPLPLHPSSTYTSASSAAAAAAQVAANSSSSKIITVSSSTSHSEQNHVSPTRASFPSSVSSSRSVSSSLSTSSASASSRVRGHSKNTPSAESKSSVQKFAHSTERETTNVSGSSNSSYTNVTTSPTSTSSSGFSGSGELSLNSSKTYVRAASSTKSSSTASIAAAATPLDTSPRAERVSEKPSPRSSLHPSQAVPQWSFQEANRITISASVVAAEREKARLSTSTSSASAAAAAAKHSVAAIPPRDLNRRDVSSSSIPVSSSSSVSALQTARTSEPHAHPKNVLAHSPRPRNAEDLFSAPRAKGLERSMVVPVSSLSESDDEGDDIYDDDPREERCVPLMDEKHDNKVGVEEVDFKPLHFVDIYTANRCCSNCGESILSTPNSLLMLTAPMLHASCPKCSTLHCRGCSRPANCPQNCSGSKSCVIRNCCPQVRAIAIFEALSIFDRDYLLEAGLNSGIRDREEFVKALISKPLTLQNRKVESILIKAMTVITEIFKTSDCQPFPPSSPSLISLWFEVVEFFERSLMPEVIRAFLDSTNVKDWIMHSATYAVMLDLLRYMLEGGSTSHCGVMDVQLRKIEKSCGLGAWMLGRGEIDWAAEVGVEKERQRQEETEDRQKKGEMSRGQLRGGEEKYIASVSFHAKIDERKLGVLFATPLKDLIPNLEKFRKSLWELSARIAFPSTVEKLNMLCDRISQLALSQVIGV